MSNILGVQLDASTGIVTAKIYIFICLILKVYTNRAS